MKFAGTKVAEEIRLLKPYSGGHPILHALHVLDVRDKHHLLILAYSYAALSGNDLNQILESIGESSRFYGIDLQFPATEDFTIARIRRKFVMRDLPNSQRETNVNMPLYVAFGHGQPFVGSPVLPTLDRMADAVKEIVSRLIEAYLSPGNTFPNT